MPTLNFCSVGTNFIPSHLSSELAVLASNSLFYLCRSNLGSCLSLSPLGWEVVREAQCVALRSLFTSLATWLLGFLLPLKSCSLNTVNKSVLGFTSIP